MARARPRRSTRGRTTLSLREQQVLQLVAEGLTNFEIGQKLIVAEETVKSHIRKVLNKTGAKTRAQAVAIAMRRKEIV